MDGLIIAKLDRCDLINTPTSDTMAFSIWFSGCHFRCRGCQNQKLWDKSSGDRYEVSNLIQIITHESSKYNIGGVALLGGEPLDQDNSELLKLCMGISNIGKEIWLYTGYDFDDIPIVIRDSCDVMKCGRYIEELRDESRFPITTNQKVYRKIAGVWKQINIRR